MKVQISLITVGVLMSFVIWIPHSISGLPTIQEPAEPSSYCDSTWRGPFLDVCTFKESHGMSLCPRISGFQQFLCDSNGRTFDTLCMFCLGYKDDFFENKLNKTVRLPEVRKCGRCNGDSNEEIEVIPLPK